MDLVMRFTRKPAPKHQGLAEQMSIPVSNPIASAPSIYMMPGYASPMPYSQMPYPYTVPLAMLAPTSPSLPTRRSSTPSPKAKIQLAIRQSSPIAPAEDPNLIIKQYIEFLQVEYCWKISELSEAGRILGQHDIDINLLREQSLSTLQSLGISLGISTYLLKHIREFKAEYIKPRFAVLARVSPLQSTLQRVEHSISIYSDTIDDNEQYTDQENVETQWDSQLMSQFEKEFADIEEFDE